MAERIFDINSTLLWHCVAGGGLAFQIRNQLRQTLIPGDKNKIEIDDRGREFRNSLCRFLEARTDLHRVDRAQKLARLLLDINDMAEYSDIREKVAELELLQLITYSKQRDHTAHTVYLFLLGVWLYDNVPAFRKHINAEDYLMQWLFASILHDIGYAFSDIGKDTIEYRKFLDNIYSSDWLIGQV